MMSRMKMRVNASLRTVPLIILVILLVSFPSVQALTESLYVDGYTGNHNTWDEKNEPTPYLADESTGYVHEVKSSGAVVGYFGFADPGGSGTINSVTLYVECYGDDTNDQIDIYVDCSDGGGWVEEGTITVNQLSYGWETLSLSTRLDSWPDIQNAQIYLYYQGVGGGDDIYVRRAYLYVDYTEAGEAYTRDVSQVMSLSGAAERGWSLTRDTSQGISLVSESQRVWSTSRLASTAIVLTPDSLRSWSLSRVVSQALSLTSNTVAMLIQLILRSVSLQVTLTSDIARSWSLLRNVSQLVATSFNANRLTTIIRSVSQTISGHFGDGGFLLLGDNPGNPIGTTSRVYFQVVNEFNTSMIMLNILTVLASGVYFLRGREVAWGAVATFFWFITALVMLVDNPSNWMTSRVYGILGSIFIVLTLVSVMRRLNPRDEYFDDWG